MFRTLPSCALPALVAVFLAGCATEDAEPMDYSITIENLSDSQVLSPGIVVVHTDDVSLWTTGDTASEGVRAIAEDGDPSRALQMLEGNADVRQMFSTMDPINRVGGHADLPEARNFTFMASPDERLSLVLMLICTNDGFAGLDSMALPAEGEARTYMVRAYDAGTEENTESFADIVDACQAAGPVASEEDGNNNDLPEDGTIHAHAGIQGDADLEEVHGWSGDVARVTIQG